MNIRLYLLSIVVYVTSTASNPLSILAADLQTIQGTQWSPYLQWTVSNPTWSGNPFDVSATVEFTHQMSRERHRTEMFFTGGKTWAFRFTGTKPGIWSFVTSSEDKNLRGHSGKVTIKPNPRSDAHGFLKKFGSKWGWEGTENVFVPQLVMWDYIAGGNSPRVFHNKPELVDRKIQEFIVGHGFNGFHVPVIGGRWFDLDAASNRVEPSMTEPDPRIFEALELLITKTHQAGGLVHIWPWGDHQRSQTPRSLTGGIGGVIDKRLQRYIAARLGPVPGWSMGYGFDLDEWVKGSQVKDWRDSIRRHMGWGHFLGGRPVGPNHGIDHAADALWNKGLDYSSYEHHRPTYEVYLAAMQATSGQPVMSEDRFRIRTGRYPEKDYNEELTRRGLCHSTMAGGVANIWGIHPDLSPGGVFPNKDQIKTYSVFFHEKDRFLEDMIIANHLSKDVDTHILFSRSAQSLVLYRENSDALHVDLTDMHAPLPAVGVDTKKAYSEIHFGDLRCKAQTIKLPSVSDWVVAVGHFSRPAKRGEHVPKGTAILSFTDIWKGPRLKGGHGAMWADVDDDGLPDLYLPLIISGTLPDLFMHNKGDGMFVEEGARRGIADPDGGSHGATWCDLDNDGDLDLLLAGSGGRGHLYFNNGGGIFTHAQSFSGAGYMGGFADLDNDGDLDLYFAGDTKVLLNNSAGHYAPGTAIRVDGANDPRGVAFADLDDDGDVDFAFGTKRATRNFIIRNDLQGGGNWLKVRLIAANGQAGAFGTKTTIYPVGRTSGAPLAMRESQSNCGYLGQNGPVLHFGLGHRNSVDVVVQFLDGTKAVRHRVAANQTILITGIPKKQRSCI